MTARQVFEATAIELSKIQAPNLKLYEFNYLFNKAINQYINKVYNIYDINQQTTDDLRVLKSTAFLTPVKVEIGKDKNKQDSAIRNTTDNSGVMSGQATSYLSRKQSSIQSLHGATYEVYMPIDYLHMLNCVCIYYVAKTKDCWDAGSYIEVPALRLTADSWSQIITDIYNRPSPMRPYYYIHNLNQNTTIPTNPNSTGGTDMDGIYKVTSNGNWKFEENEEGEGEWKFEGIKDNTSEKSNFQRTFTLNDNDVSLVEKPIALRAGNVSNVRCEIRYGKKLNKNIRFC